MTEQLNVSVSSSSFMSEIYLFLRFFSTSRNIQCSSVTLQYEQLSSSTTYYCNLELAKFQDGGPPKIPQHLDFFSKNWCYMNVVSEHNIFRDQRGTMQLRRDCGSENAEERCDFLSIEEPVLSLSVHFYLSRDYDLA